MNLTSRLTGHLHGKRRDKRNEQDDRSSYMHDLNLTLFYKTSFQIRALDGDGDALWALFATSGTG